MPWYRIKANTGPGHQSKRLEYVWRDEKLSKEEKSDLFEEKCKFEWYTDSAVGDVKPVSRLPEKVRLEKISGYRGTIAHAQRMLKRLGA